MKGSDLREYLLKEGPSWVERTKLALQISLSIQHLHKSGIIHRDIKTENILISMKNSDTTSKLCDFGFSR